MGVRRRQNIHVIGRGWEYGKYALKTQCLRWVLISGGTQAGGAHSTQRQKHEKWRRLDAGKEQNISQNVSEQSGLVGI